MPQNKVVLQRFLGLRIQFPKEKVRKVVNILYKEMIIIWKAARIFTDKEKKCKYRILDVIQKFKNFKKNDDHNKLTNGGPKNLPSFRSFLEQLCDLAPPNLKELIQNTARLNKDWKEDWQFYLNMTEPKQVGLIAGKDTKLAVKEDNKLGRESEDIQKKDKSDALKRKHAAVVTGSEFDDGNKSEEDSSKDPNVIFTKKNKSKRAKVMLEIDPKLLVGQTTSTSDRLGMSSRQTAMLLASVVKSGGGDLSQVTLSKSSVQRKRKQARKKQGTKIIKSFNQSEDGFILHYDTKLVNPKGKDTEDRAAVLYSGGEHKQP